MEIWETLFELRLTDQTIAWESRWLAIEIEMKWAVS